MSRVSLPSINNGQGHVSYDEQKSPQFDVEPIVEEEEYNENKFNDTVQRLANQPFPEPMNDQCSMKNRITNLERTAEVQSDFNKLSHRTFINLSGDLVSTEEALKDLINQVQNTFDSKLASMKKEYDHR